MSDEEKASPPRDALELGRRIFSSFLYTKDIPPEKRDAFIREAEILGESRAAEIARDYPGKTPSEIIRANGVRIGNELYKEANTAFVRFAEYRVKRNEVVLNRTAIEIIEEEMKPPLPEEIILCHELYHYFESTRWGDTAKDYIITVTLPFGLRVRRTLIPMSEIAANTFVCGMLNLDFQPKHIETIYFRIVKKRAEEKQNEINKKLENETWLQRASRFFFNKKY